MAIQGVHKNGIFAGNTRALNGIFPPIALQNRLPVQRVSNFQYSAPPAGTAIAAAVSGNGLDVMVGNSNGAARLRFNQNATSNVISKNPGGIVSKLAQSGATLTSASQPVVGNLLGELGVNVTADSIQVSDVRVEDAQATKNAILKQNGLAQQNSRNVLKLFDEPAPAQTSGSKLELLQQAAAANQQTAPNIITLFDGPTTAPAPAPNQAGPMLPLESLGTRNRQEMALDNPPPVEQAPAVPETPAPESSGPNATESILMASLAVAFASIMNANTQAPKPVAETDNAGAGVTTYSGEIDLTMNVEVSGTLYSDGNTTVTGTGSATVGGRMSGEANFSDDAFNMQGSASMEATATGTITTETQITDNVSVENKYTGTASAYVKAEGNVGATNSDDEKGVTVAGNVGGGVEVSGEVEQTINAGDSSLTTKFGASGGISAGGGVIFDISFTDEGMQFDMGASGDLGIGIDLEVAGNLNYDNAKTVVNKGKNYITGALSALAPKEKNHK